MRRTPAPAARRSSGVSQVELIVTIAIAGLLAAVAIPRFAGRDAFDSRGFFDAATGVVRYAQKTAIAWRKEVFVCVTSTGIAAAASSGCAAPLAHPLTGEPLVASVPSGVSVAPAGEFRFDGFGRPSAATTLAISSTVAGDPARQIVVEAETGYVRR